MTRFALSGTETLARLPSAAATAWLILLTLPLLAGCQALARDESAATLAADFTAQAAESDSIRAAATRDRGLAVETLAAASTKVAEYSALNAALGATLRANFTQTPAVRAVIVSAEDMGASLEEGMMNESVEIPVFGLENDVSELATALAVDAASGCSAAAARQFRPSAERIYVTARVSGLREGSEFTAAWSREGRRLHSESWTADFARAETCVWFYATPTDFDFLPGEYTAEFFVNGAAAGRIAFAVSES